MVTWSLLPFAVNAMLNVSNEAEFRPGGRGSKDCRGAGCRPKPRAGRVHVRMEVY